MIFRMGSIIELKSQSPPSSTTITSNDCFGYRCRVSDADYRQAIRHWRLRRWQGRVLSVLRLAKAVFTFNNCVDYAVWKIQRHTGERIPMTPALQRHPLLQGSRLLWQLLRRGVLR